MSSLENLLDRKAVPSSIIDSYVRERQVAGAFLDELLTIAGSELLVVEAIITHVRPSANSLKDLMQLIKEIAVRDKQSWSEVAAAVELNQALSSDSRGAKDKLKEIRRRLEQLRFPETAKLEAELEQCRRAIIRDYGVSISLPIDLEGDHLSLSLEFNSSERLADFAERLMKLSRSDELQRAFALLTGEFENFRD